MPEENLELNLDEVENTLVDDKCEGSKALTVIF